MDEIKYIRINKNRGWRGLAEAKLINNEGNETMSMIFSFSQPVWNDMLEGHMVFEDNDNYIVVHFHNTADLPSPSQQRSVLIKNFMGSVYDISVFPKADWMRLVDSKNHLSISHYKKNNNKHTTSDWNCIGIRVVPMI